MDGAKAGSGEVPELLLQKIKAGLAKVSPRSTSWSIFTVPNKLRSVKAGAYDPHILSIGPFHHGRPNLAGMQTHKWRYTLSLLERTQDAIPTMESCLKAILGFDHEIRACYAEPITHEPTELAEILFLDGCFILELFLRYSNNEPNLNHGDLQNDPIFTTSWIISTLQRDMALLENQIPFFVLEWLFDYTVRRSSSRVDSLPDIALGFFKSAISGSLPRNPAQSTAAAAANFQGRETIRMERRQSTKHLLHLIHTSYRPSSPKAEARLQIGAPAAPSAFVPSVGELCAAGIQVQMQRKPTKSMLDLKFKNGVLKIPPLRIHDSTDALFRNLVAFEQCFHGCPQYITSYVLLMDRLVYTMDDVELLEQSMILENYLGSRAEAADLFDSICKQIGIQDFYFPVLCDQLNEFYCRRWTSYWVDLRRNYFTSKWTLASVFAAFLLLTMALVQTLYTVLSYYSYRK
ncbi:unnamed protein product [Linum trigynum]|uniref:Uncharacterized protein n=1 Tax=Linum trigynum TaxID=586398 RepID=A0AAV2G7S6_9ROSI